MSEKVIGIKEWQDKKKKEKEAEVMKRILEYSKRLKW